MLLRFDSGGTAYDIVIGKDCISDASGLFNLDRKVLVVTDDGVPEAYPRAVLDHCPAGSLLVLPQGEGSKSMTNLERIFGTLLDGGFTRSDAIVAVGGGMVGDLSGFAAACYLRGIDYYNVPTTLLSQVDSSIGGKTAVNFHGVKNIVGAFHHPSGVLVDTSVLETLNPRLFAEGMAEVIKMAATSDAALFRLLESAEDVRPLLPDIIAAALRIKLDVVMRDPCEKGLRAVLNFGHTIGHAIESAGRSSGDMGDGAGTVVARDHVNGRGPRECVGGMSEAKSNAPSPISPEEGPLFLHGEAVAAGMTYTSFGEARSRIETLLRKFGLPVSDPFSAEELMRFARSDKKRSGELTRLITVDTIGTYSIREVNDTELLQLIQARKNEK